MCDHRFELKFDFMTNNYLVEPVITCNYYLVESVISYCIILCAFVACILGACLKLTVMSLHLQSTATSVSMCPN
jgi:hypothetical protein